VTDLVSVFGRAVQIDVFVPLSFPRIYLLILSEPQRRVIRTEKCQRRASSHCYCILFKERADIEYRMSRDLKLLTAPRQPREIVLLSIVVVEFGGGCDGSAACM
jgi:hypothetical protein